MLKEHTGQTYLGAGKFKMGTGGIVGDPTAQQLREQYKNVPGMPKDVTDAQILEYYNKAKQNNFKTIPVTVPKEGSAFSDWWYNTEDVQKTYKMANEVNPFVYNWMNNSITNKKLANQIGNLKEWETGKYDVSNINNKLNTLPVYDYNKMNGLSTSDFVYNHNLQGFKNSNYNSEMINDLRDLEGLQGTYIPQIHSISVRNINDRGTTTHEITHGLDDVSIDLEREIDLSFGNEKLSQEEAKKTPYYSGDSHYEYLKKDGLYPRIMNIRDKWNLVPGEKIDINRIKNSDNIDINNIRNFYPDSTIVKLFNTIAYNKTNDDNLLANNIIPTKYKFATGGIVGSPTASELRKQYSNVPGLNLANISDEAILAYYRKNNPNTVPSTTTTPKYQWKPATGIPSNVSGRLSPTDYTLTNDAIQRAQPRYDYSKVPNATQLPSGEYVTPPQSGAIEESYIPEEIAFMAMGAPPVFRGAGLASKIGNIGVDLVSPFGSKGKVATKGIDDVGDISLKPLKQYIPSQMEIDFQNKFFSKAGAFDIVDLRKKYWKNMSSEYPNINGGLSSDEFNYLTKYGKGTKEIWIPKTIEKKSMAQQYFDKTLGDEYRNIDAIGNIIKPNISENTKSLQDITDALSINAGFVDKNGIVTQAGEDFFDRFSERILSYYEVMYKTIPNLEFNAIAGGKTMDLQNKLLKQKQHNNITKLLSGQTLRNEDAIGGFYGPDIRGYNKPLKVSDLDTPFYKQGGIVKDNTTNKKYKFKK